jgi:hypothetical protein
MRVPAGLLGVLLLVQPATADEVAVPDAQAPPVLYLAGQSHAGTAKLAVITAAGDRTQSLLDDVPLGSYGLAVHPATGRWALTFGQLSNGDPLKIADKAVSKAGDRNTLVLGDLTGVVATTYGDPGCTSKKRACFETPHQFSADGAYVFVDAMTSSTVTLSRWSFAKKPKRSALTDKKHGGMEIAPDLKRASYLDKDGIHVVAWPAQKKKAAKIKLSKKAAVDPDLLMSGPWPIGDRLYWFRREPVEQKRGYFEAYDLTTKQTVVLREATADFPMMNGAFLSTGPRGTVLFLDDVLGNFNRLDVFEATGDQSVAIAHDIRQMLDVSPDGRFLLATRWKDVKVGETGTNPEVLVIIDLQTKREISALEVGVRINDAAFVATMP